MHLLCFGDQLIAEIRMRNADQSLGGLPGTEAFEVDCAVLGHDIHGVGTRVGHDAAGSKSGTDAACKAAVLVLESGGHADEGLAALGAVCAQNEVKLAAGTGDLSCACALCVDLTIEVDIDRVVDGNKFIETGDSVIVVDIVDGSGLDLGVIVEIDLISGLLSR